MTRAEKLAVALPSLHLHPNGSLRGEWAGLAITVWATSRSTNVEIGSYFYPCSAPVTSGAAWREALTHITTIHRLDSRMVISRPLPLTDRVRNAIANAEPGTEATARKVILDYVHQAQSAARAAARAQIATLDAERDAINAILDRREPTP